MWDFAIITKMLKKISFILIVIILVVQMIISWRNYKTEENLRFNRINGNNASSTIVSGNESIVGKINTTQTPTIINIVASSHQFTPNIIKAKVNVPLKVRILSLDGNHNFTVDEFRINTNTPSGTSTDVIFIPDKKGTFRFYSSYLEDVAKGMAGELIVK
jgi:heme/copper-type cytochrome/quinol oxidase subunit 2